MDRIFTKFADTIMYAHFSHLRNTWQVDIEDSLTGKRYLTEWTVEQMNAVMFLHMAGDDELIKAIQDKLYAIAEPLFANCPAECRMIP